MSVQVCVGRVVEDYGRLIKKGALNLGEGIFCTLCALNISARDSDRCLFFSGGFIPAVRAIVPLPYQGGEIWQVF